MNWIAFGAAAWILFGVELGLRDALELGSVGVAPSFVVLLLVFVALSAPGVTAITGAMILGVVLDLTHTVPVVGTADSMTVVGPYALGCAAGAYAVSITRSLVMHHNPLTVGFLAALASLVIHVVASTLLTVRTWYDPLEFAATHELGVRAASAAFTGVVAVLVWPLLRPLAPLFAFPASGSSRRRWA